MPETDKVPGPVALLFVHGIGAQERGDTIGKLSSGLRRICHEPTTQGISDDMVATVGGQPVRFYEVYWADLLKGDITHGAFQMNELQSLSWFPWFNLRRGNYRSGTYSWLKLAWWCVALPIANFFMLLAYYGAGFFAQTFGQIFKGDEGKKKETKTDGSLMQRAMKAADDSSKLTTVDRLLDEYVGDVFSYVNSAGNAFYREEKEPPVPPQVERVYADIVQRFYDQLVKAQADGCTTIQVVAHSLGTVVTYHALSGFRFDPGRDDAGVIREARAKVRHLYTIGSPLEKIRFFWPRLAPCAAPLGEMSFQWDNFVSWFDPVAGTLKSEGGWGQVSNHRLLGGGFLRGHVVYEHSPVFLGALAQGLCGHVIPFERGPRERVRDWFLLIGESLLAPAMVAIVLTAGAAIFGAVILLLPFLISWAIRWFLPLETWQYITNILSLVMLAAMSLALLMAPLIRAKKVHSLYWAATPSGLPASAGA